MTFRDQILTALVGPEGAKALRKAAERLPHLDNAMLPRALYAWVRLAGHGYEGEIPGVGGGHLSLRKSGDAFAGAMAFGEVSYGFDSASLLHVAAALGVVMGLERNRVPENVTDEDLYRLGKSVDALVSARTAHAALRKKMSEKPEFSFEHERDVTSQPPKTVVYALDVNGKEIGRAVATQTASGADLQSLTVDRRRHPTLEKKLMDAIEGVTIGQLRKAESSLPPHSLMSAENPLFPTKMKLSNTEAVQKLRDMGEDAHATVGSYGKPENSMVIYHPKNQKAIEDFARDLGQESVIHSDGASHKMVMVNGENAGKHHPGQGTQWHAQKPEDYYTVLPDGRIFTHDFDFNTLHGDLSKAGKGGAEAPGPAHRPTAQAAPLMPDAPSRQQNQPPKVRFHKPPAPTPTKIPKLRLSERQLSATCPVCDGHQLAASGAFQACYCFRDLASDVKLEKKESSYLLSFGGKWNEHSIFAFLDTISRGSDHAKE